MKILNAVAQLLWPMDRIRNYPKLCFAVIKYSTARGVLQVESALSG
jgi:hypothetical protein